MQTFEKKLVNSKLTTWLHKHIIFPSFFNFIRIELDGKTLEIGCGIGKTTEQLAKRYNKLKIIAIDYDKEQIEQAMRNNHKNIIFQQGDATKLQFGNDSFDYVIETNTFHHIKDYQKAIGEAHRILKSKGVFYVMDISRYFFIWPLSFLFPPESRFSKQEFIAALEQNGFIVTKTAGIFLFFLSAKKGVAS